MKYRYYLCDVFTDRRFGGNQLAVFPDARGLSDHQMQQIAREFNFSESTFVFPAEIGITPDIHVYTKSHDKFDIRARMFAPLDNVPEDPATGSANCALAGLLAHHNAKPSGSFHWKIAQGMEMGRPALLAVRAQKQAGEVLSTWVAGSCVMVGEGWMNLNET